jgi:hypothetical protein
LLFYSSLSSDALPLIFLFIEEIQREEKKPLELLPLEQSDKGAMLFTTSLPGT